jgi:hypothetical protein
MGEMGGRGMEHPFTILIHLNVSVSTMHTRLASSAPQTVADPHAVAPGKHAFQPFHAFAWLVAHLRGASREARARRQTESRPTSTKVLGVRALLRRAWRLRGMR